MEVALYQPTPVSPKCEIHKVYFKKYNTPMYCDSISQNTYLLTIENAKSRQEREVRHSGSMLVYEDDYSSDCKIEKSWNSKDVFFYKFTPYMSFNLDNIEKIESYNKKSDIKIEDWYFISEEEALAPYKVLDFKFDIEDIYSKVLYMLADKAYIKATEKYIESKNTKMGFFQKLFFTGEHAPSEKDNINDKYNWKDKWIVANPLSDELKNRINEGIAELLESAKSHIRIKLD